MPHHTKDKGGLGVMKAQADLASQGFMILHPLTEHAPFDLVIYKDCAFHRVQVRFRTCKRGCLNVRLRSIWNDKHGTHITKMNKDEVDIVCIYCPDTDECYYFDPGEAKESITLRVRPAGNRQKKAVRLASDYRQVRLGS